MKRVHEMKQQTGPIVRKVSRNEIPIGKARGREAFILALPFWNQLVAQLDKGLTPSEAIEIDLKPVADASGKSVDPENLVTRIRHQFRKNGYSDRFSLLAPKGSNRLFVVDHKQTAAA